MVVAGKCPGKKRFWVGAASLAAAVLLGCGIGLLRQPKFHDVTVELGTEVLTVRDFLTESARPGNARFLTDAGSIDLGRVGQTQVELRYGMKRETVTLTVEDTTPPAAVIAKSCQVPANQLPEASSLVTDIQDLSEVKVYYRREPVVPLDYRDTSVTVVVEDAFGNAVEQECLFSFRWIREECTIELGEPLDQETLLYHPSRDSFMLDQVELNRIKAQGLGEYTVVSRWEDREQSCHLTVQDTTPPDLVLKGVQLRRYRKLRLKDFLVSATDASGVKEVRLLTELDGRQKGKFPVLIEAEDNCGNIIRAETTLWVASDYTAPQIEGDFEELTLEKNSQLPDLLEGITATDLQDGQVEVECDTGSLNPGAGGTYYVTYRATDSSGNTATKKRKITVLHDEEDTLALAQSIADKLNDDPLQIRRYVLNQVGYNQEWGGEDPVWYGFTTRRGNCYVHALCMKSILDVKGIENQLIWVEDKSHYWLIVKVDGQWKHMDPTPTRSPLPDVMNDRRRLATLSGRKWDTSQWPACE